MGVLGHVHQRFVHQRRVEVLADAVARVMPPSARVLDIGCGDGLLAKRILEKRNDLSITGVDVLLRPNTYVPVAEFDGVQLPFEDRSVDVVLFVDVLHHTTDPTVLLREAQRVAADSVVIKDHTKDGFLAGQTLALMDWVGNARYGVALPFNYWPEARWRGTFEDLSLYVAYWRKALALYPWSHTWLCDRSLHFIARLTNKRRAQRRRSAQPFVAGEATPIGEDAKRSRQDPERNTLDA